jgi:hypothetical protein
VIDHLIYATPDLEQTVKEFGDALGVVPQQGGPHVGLGSRNALVALGAGVYLEIVGIDPEQEAPPEGRLFGLDEVAAPRLAAWCASPAAPLEKIVASGLANGYDAGEILEMSRARPDGVMLRWRMTSARGPREGGVLPFFIDWGENEHPARALAPGLRLAAFGALHPQPRRIRALLSIFDERVTVECAAEPGLEAKIEGPRGTLHLR